MKTASASFDHCVLLQPLRGLLLLFILTTAGCSVYGPQSQEPPAPVEEPQSPVDVPPATPVQPPRPSDIDTGKAYEALLDRAVTATRKGQNDTALALLERAQRVAPHSADVYLQMARTYSASGDDEQSRTMAERGLLYCDRRSQCRALRWLAD